MQEEDERRNENKGNDERIAKYHQRIVDQTRQHQISRSNRRRHMGRRTSKVIKE
jgi:hypothetical protein